MRDVSNKNCRENQNTHFIANNVFSEKKSAVYEVMSKNKSEAETPQTTIRQRGSCWIIKATFTQKCATLSAVPKHQWFP